jgi:hypothetical protein
LNESELGVAIQTLGFTYASYRMMTKNGTVTVANEKASEVNFDLKNLSSLENANIKKVEAYLDDALKNFTKAPLKKGEGVRYFDGKGNSWQLNYGYKNATDRIHGAPYLKTTINGKIIRIPLTK